MNDEVENMYLELTKHPGIGKIKLFQIEILYAACNRISEQYPQSSFKNKVLKANTCLENILIFNDPFPIIN